MYPSDKPSDVQDEPEVLRDAPAGKPEPASLPSVRVVATPMTGNDKPTYIPEYVPRLSHKRAPRTPDHRPFGR